MGESLGPIAAPVAYSSTLQLGPAPVEVSYIALACTKPIYVTCSVPDPGGGGTGKYTEEGFERYLAATQLFAVTITNISGIKIRSADPANLATVQAELAYVTDPQFGDPGSGFGFPSGIPAAGGSQLIPTAVFVNSYAAAVGDLVLMDVSAGDLTVTLPATPPDLSQVGVKIVSRNLSNSFRARVSCSGADVFNVTGGGAINGPNLDLLQLGQTLVVQYQASTGLWHVIQNVLPLGQTIGDAIVALVPGNTGGGSLGINFINSGNWSKPLILPNDHALRAHVPGGAGVSDRELIGMDSASVVQIGDAAAGLAFKQNVGAVTGSRLASPALASLLTTLATAGLIIDNTTV